MLTIKFFPWLAVVILGILAFIASLANFFPLKNTFTQIGGGYFIIPGINLLSGDNNSSNIFYVAMYCCMASLVGAAVQLKFFPKLIKNPHYRLLIPVTGFFSGYLIFVAINRLLSLNIEKQFSLPMIILVTFSITALSLVYVIKSKIWKNKYEALKSSVISIFLILSALIFGIQSQQSKVIGDAAATTINTLLNISVDHNNKFPLIGQHYDETSFLLPVSWVTEGSQPGVLVWFLFIYSFGRVASLTLIYLCIKRVSNNSWFSALLVSCLFFTSFTPSPIGIPLLFDSGSILAINLHIGRILIVTLAILVFSQLAISEIDLPKITPINLLVLFCLGIGLSALSPHILWVLMGCAIFLVYRQSTFLNLHIQNALLFFLPIIMMLTIPEPDFFKLLLFGLYLVAAFVYILSTSWNNLQSFSIPQCFRKSKSEVLQFLAILGGLVVGYCLLGNSFTSKVISKLGLNIEVLKLRDVKADINAFGINPFIDQFPFEHQQNFLYFMYFFGSAIFLIAFSAVISFQGFNSVRDLRLIQVIFVTSIMLGVSFYIWDFINSGSVGQDPWLSIWLKSRLVEPYYYVVTCLSSIVVYKYVQLKTAKFKLNLVTLCLALYLFVAFLMPLPGGMIGQFVYNFSQVISYINHYLLSINLAV